MSEPASTSHHPSASPPPTPTRPWQTWGRDLAWSSLLMGLMVALIGTASSFSVIMQGLTAAGATPEQVASGLMALSITKGVFAIVLSLAFRRPYSLAWSTSGAALLVATGPIAGGFEAAVGAFIIASVLLALTGMIRPMARAVAAIPAPLAHAMLAGVLLPLCLAPFKTLSLYPLWGLILLATWLLARQIHSLLAVPAALLAFAGILSFGIQPDWAGLLHDQAGLWTPLVWVWPQFSLTAAASLALPLYLVTMAGQNLPGQAALRLNGFPQGHASVLAASGVAGLLSAPFGGHANNLAAITAALCSGPDAHRDPARRYWASVWAGILFIPLGLFAGLCVRFITLAPVLLIQTIAGLALLGTFSGALLSAFQHQGSRVPAAITFLLTASGVSILGIAGAFWGLVLGGLILTLQSRLKPSKSTPDAR